MPGATCGISRTSSRGHAHANSCSARLLGQRRPFQNAGSRSRCCAYTELYDIASFEPTTIAVGGGIAAVAALVGWRTYLYSQLELVTATFMGRMVPVVSGEGARVMQLGGSTKELFYYPKGTALVTMVDPDANPSLYEQAGLQAQVGVVTKKQAPADLRFAADNSADAVVALRSLGRLPQEKVLPALEEVHRVLKPGAPLVFVERVEDTNAPLRLLLGSTTGLLGTEFFTELKESPKFDVVSWEVTLQGQDAHAIGVAMKARSVEGGGRPSKQGKQRAREGRAGSEAAGFS